MNGPDNLIDAPLPTAPLAEAVTAAGHPGLAPVVRIGAVVAALGSLLALILGVSRTTLAMARDRHLPGTLAAIHPRFDTPYRAEIAVGVVVAVVVVGGCVVVVVGGGVVVVVVVVELVVDGSVVVVVTGASVVVTGLVTVEVSTCPFGFVCVTTDLVAL